MYFLKNPFVACELYEKQLQADHGQLAVITTSPDMSLGPWTSVELPRFFSPLSKAWLCPL